MKLFEMKNWQLTVSEEVWGLLPFKQILERDKTKDKEKAMKEMLFIYFYSDVKSDYIIYEHDIRVEEIKRDVGLPEDWEYDQVIQDAIDLYEKNSQTIIEKLYKQSLKSASDIGDFLENSAVLLREKDNSGKYLLDVSKLTTALGRVPKLMSDLKSAYKEVVKEQEDMENRKKGSKQFNTFERGLGEI